MALLAECPVCRQSLHWTYLWRPMWTRWSCSACGSLLTIDWKRRLLSILIMPLAFLVSMYLARNGWPGYMALSVVLVLWLPCFLVLDRAAVLERRGFRCQQCGYDLRGQIAPRCPECGRELDADECAILETGVFPHGPTPRRSRAWLAIPLLVFAFLLTSLAVGITHWAGRARLARLAAGGVPLTQPAAGTQPAAEPPLSEDSG